MKDFKSSLEEKFKHSLSNKYGIDNFDEYRFGEFQVTIQPNRSTLQNLKRIIKKLIRYKKNSFKNDIQVKKDYLLQVQKEKEKILNIYGNKLQYLYELLTTNDRKKLIEIIAYRILGYKKVKLSRNNKKYWNALNLVKDLSFKNDKYDPHFLHFVLKKFDLRKIGFPLQLYFSEIGVAIDFILEQYAYKEKNNVIVSVEQGDVVFDLGACWGDTALYFANKTTNTGMVYSFEFIPDNIKLFNLNVNLNPNHKPQIKLIPNPVSNKSGQKIYYKDHGPGSRIEFEPFDDQTGIIETISIDDFVINENIKKVDFIKMDIEGAELPALEGAVETIRKYKPRLAIAIYHSMDDLVNIPLWINNLNLGYTIYLDHFSIHSEETVLFAIADK